MQDWHVLTSVSLTNLCFPGQIWFTSYLKLGHFRCQIKQTEAKLNPGKVGNALIRKCEQEGCGFESQSRQRIFSCNISIKVFLYDNPAVNFAANLISVSCIVYLSWYKCEYVADDPRIRMKIFFSKTKATMNHRAETFQSILKSNFEFQDLFGTLSLF